MDGLLLFNKPMRWTSHDVVDFVRKRLHQKKVGHAGTLDPLATGLLILLLGRATKRSNELMGLDKDYAGVFTLGSVTDTLDSDGKILSTHDFSAVTEKNIQSLFSEMLGLQAQTAPVYSAIKKEGKKLYELARAGVAVEAPERQIHISSLKLIQFKAPYIHFSVSCSKGTYVRSLARDVGEKLGCGAMLSSLTRTRIGDFHLKDAISEKDILSYPAEKIEKLLR